MDPSWRIMISSNVESAERSCLKPVVWPFARLLVTNSIRRIDASIPEAAVYSPRIIRLLLASDAPPGPGPTEREADHTDHQQHQQDRAAVAQAEQARGRRTDRRIVAAGVRQRTRRWAAPRGHRE